jgi:hypothetical protein
MLLPALSHWRNTEHERKQGQNEGLTMADYDSKHASKDAYGNITAKDQHGIDQNAKPRKSDKKSWEFGDSLTNITPDKIA